MEPDPSRNDETGEAHELCKVTYMLNPSRRFCWDHGVWL